MDPRLLEVAGRLKSARIVKRATLDEAAQVMGVNKNTINRCETGKQVPDVAYLLAFSEFSERSVAWLITGAEVDETSFSLKERQYHNLIGVVSSVLAHVMAEKNKRIKWQHYGKVVKLLFRLSLGLMHEGTICFYDEDTSDLEAQLEQILRKEIDNIFALVDENIFEDIYTRSTQ